MDIAVIDECRNLSTTGKITFLEVVAKLSASHVERYIADLNSMTLSYYSGSGQMHTAALDLPARQVASSFRADDIKEAIRDSQQQRINYKIFLERITDAGCCHYEVYIAGRKIMYFGRDGSHHIEHFPQAT
jgi:uncharacterized protein YbcV (DUF1398 family)